MNSAFDRMYEVTALSRPLDPRNLTNLLILILTPVAGGVAGGFALASGVELALAARIGFSTSVITLLAWILSREIDIDHPWSAFLSVGLALVGFYLVQRNLLLGEEPRLLDTALLSLILAIPSTRMVSRIVGPPARLADSVAILFLIVLVSFLGVWVVGFVGVLALLLDGLLPEPNRRNLLFALLGLVVIGARVVILPDIGEPGALTLPYLATITAISVAYGATIIATRQVQVGCDLEGYPLNVQRVRAAMLLGLVFALVVAVWDGNAGVLKMLPLWAALLGTAIYRLPATIWGFRSRGQKSTSEKEPEADVANSTR